MMKFGKTLPWYLKQGLDVTGQGLKENGKYFGRIVRISGNLVISTSPSNRHYGSPCVAIDRSVWNQYRVVEPA